MQKTRPIPRERLERRLRHRFGLSRHLARSIADLRRNEVLE